MQSNDDNMASVSNNRMKNSVRNIISGIFLVAFVTVIPFVIRTLMVYTIGFDYLGLNSLFLSIIQILNMSELGIGSVMMFFLYSPVALGDKEKINAYLNALKRLYKIIGLVVLVSGMIITPFLDRFVNGDIPVGSNIRLYFIMYLMAMVIQYYMYPEEVSLIEAFQRKDVTNRISFLSNGFCYIMQIAALYFYHSYLVYVVAVMLQNLAAGCLRRYYGHKYFGDYVPGGTLSSDEKKDVRVKVTSMIGHQIDAKLFNSIDTVMISAIIGLSSVAVYSNYFYVIMVVSMVFDIIYESILPSIGNAVAVESEKDNLDRFYSLFWIGTSISGWATAALLCLYQNFMKLWMGKDNMLGMDMVILFCVYFYLSQIRRTVVTYKNAAGMWWNDRYKPYVSMIIDLVIDVVLIRMIGVKGAIISSIICVGVFEIPWETKVFFRDYFHISIKQYIIKALGYSLINFGVIALIYVLCELAAPAAGIKSLFIRMLICCAGAGLYALIYRNNAEMNIWLKRFKTLSMKSKS